MRTCTPVRLHGSYARRSAASRGRCSSPDRVVRGLTCASSSGATAARAECAATELVESEAGGFNL
jgi:hypothetical protein